ncbi:MAG: 16S rRNA (guanine(527)-N(7))-methyltransferase RsmG [Lentimicrobiaceae bacterium]|jgi:16S rRNA (guanine527-N7)-methyltransferase|nr:16S rRNA (guanine(527)-N(7))-methyltransferase RsmG [Lentimicrobiaceae bacterium]
MNTNPIFRYFPELNSQQRERFEKMQALYADWNSKINVISRKDMDNFYLHHVLHSLAIAKYFDLLPGMKVLDAGTGGGFPGIPLALFFSQTDFLLVDSIGKKTIVAQAIAETLGLNNVRVVNDRVEKIKGPFDVIVSRAVTRLPEMVNWVGQKLRCKGDIEAGGIMYLKGGDIKDELKELPRHWKTRTIPISNWFCEDYFETKSIVHIF